MEFQDTLVPTPNVKNHMGLGPIFLRRPLISYMLLHNKLPQDFQLKQQVPSQSVCGSRIGG